MAVQNLFLGFGGTGTHILTYLKEFAHYKFGEKPDYIDFLEFDTIASENWRPGETINIAGMSGQEETIFKGEEVSLDPSTEYCFLKDDQGQLQQLASGAMRDKRTRKNDYPHFDNWFHTDWLTQILPGAALNISRGAAQQRQIGRYAMFANVDPIVQRISSKIRDMSTRAGDDRVNVWIVGSAAGGTGAGCFIDAAYIARMAGKSIGHNPVVTGVLVLPQVYSDKSGVQKARAYALLRELERVQEAGLNTSDDRYNASGSIVASDVRYDRDERQKALPELRVFDYLIYLSEVCQKEEDRVRFFGSAASAIDPYVDRNVGNTMMEKVVNTTGTPTGMGAARLSLPKNTYAEKFSWGEVQVIFDSLMAPKIHEALQQPNGLKAGSDTDRKKSGEEKVQGLYPLFKTLLELDSSDEISKFAQLKPKDIVEKWYGFGAMTAADLGVSDDEFQTIPLLAYCNPYHALTAKPDSDLSVDEIALPTFGENKKNKNGLSEKPNESVSRFSRRLLEIKEDYLKEEVADRNFARGRQFVFEKTKDNLISRVNEIVQNEFTTLRDLTVDPDDAASGTSFTRLKRELEMITVENGPLAGVEKRVIQLIDAASRDFLKSQVEQNAKERTTDLSDTKAGGLFKGGTGKVDRAQKDARDAQWAFIQAQQKDALLKDMLELVRIARTQFVNWTNAFDEASTTLVIPKDAENRTCYQKVVGRLRSLDRRLNRMSKDASLLISLDAGNQNDTTMQGYEAVLRDMAVRLDGEATIGQKIAAEAKWEQEVAPNGSLTLKLTFGDGVEKIEHLSELHQALYKRVRSHVDAQIQEANIFSYLIYAQKRLEGAPGSPKNVVDMLAGRAKSLLRVNSGTPKYQWVHASPGTSEGDNYASALLAALRAVKTDATEDSIPNHSDPNSITLLIVSSPDSGEASDITDVKECAEEYMKDQREIGEGQKNLEKLRNTLIYHAFRQEQEAWFIERKHVLKFDQPFTDPRMLTPTRVTRLLEYPAYTSAFVRCVATGAIFYDQPTRKWKFKQADSEVIDLTEEGSDLIRAMVVFCIQHKPASGQTLRKLTAEGAEDAARAAAKADGISLADALDNFGDEKSEKIEAFVDEHYKTSEENLQNKMRQARVEAIRDALVRVLRFYSTIDRKTDLSSRSV